MPAIKLNRGFGSENYCYCLIHTEVDNHTYKNNCKIGETKLLKQRHSEGIAFHLIPEEREGISFTDNQRRAFLTEKKSKRL